jgi:hypothetical protein
VEQELTAAGFELLKTIDWPISSTVKHYCMLFRKPSGDISADISQPILTMSGSGAASIITSAAPSNTCGGYMMVAMPRTI